jgi:hypothetical protein
VTKPIDKGGIDAVARARELTEEALALLARAALDELHHGLEAGDHLEGAEHTLRATLRELVLAERELRSRSGAEPDLDEIGDVPAGLA